MKRSSLGLLVLMLSSLMLLGQSIASADQATHKPEIFANQGWQDSGVTLHAGQRYRIAYVSGTWTYWNGVIAPFDAAGDSYICPAENCCEPLPSARKGGLLGKLGDAVFFIGNGGAFTAATTGTLLLRMNDCDDSFADNSGSVIMRVNKVPFLMISDVSVVEGTGTALTYAGFKVMLSAPSNQTVTVAYTTVDGTAIAPADYKAKNGTLTFGPGQIRKTVWVLVKGDAQSEANETFRVRLSNPFHATIAVARGVAIITDDDSSTEPSVAASVSSS